MEGEQHRAKFDTSGAKRSDSVLGLVHSDVCGKMSTQSLSGSEYFLTFIDDKTRYMWVYILKRKDQVFEQFLEWKALAEKSTGHELKSSGPTVKGMTPCEALTGEKPRVDTLRVFGCSAYAHIPKDERQKFDSKARRCIFLRYGTVTKGYRLYNMNCSKVLYSREEPKDDEPRKPAEQDMYLDTGSDAESGPSGAHVWPSGGDGGPGWTSAWTTST